MSLPSTDPWADDKVTARPATSATVMVPWTSRSLLPLMLMVELVLPVNPILTG